MSAKGGESRRNREKRKTQSLKEQQNAVKGTGDTGESKGYHGKAKGKSKSRIQVCFAWSRDAEGCPSPCPNGRAHVCESCGSSEHMGSGCAEDW